MADRNPAPTGDKGKPRLKRGENHPLVGLVVTATRGDGGILLNGVIRAVIPTAQQDVGNLALVECIGTRHRGQHALIQLTSLVSADSDVGRWLLADEPPELSG